MVISRGYSCVKLLKSCQPSRFTAGIRNSSHGTWNYRSYNEPPQWEKRTALALGTFMWGWIIYHFINDFDHITGEYVTPDPSLWTDEELGIPPDSAGPAPLKK
ncbi:UNVERIFIED_CONTAM: hypothetical protein PYX00_002072 [Menopon gallinae]|uniref:NADH dehydrogenase [ubiquinone] 1 beta subcomplex subunit 2, mitochondrial n=1 Tax=Menopon gallinae TaxID=328185 RepID=A0AAW2IFI1_9NEOP